MNSDNRHRILVVDDEEVNRLILLEILQDRYEVIQAADGFEAVTAMFNTEHTPDMVLLDLMMPDMDGFEVFSVMKNNPATAKIPVIFITASNVSDNEMKGLQLGAMDYITKPFRPDIVRQRVDNNIGMSDYRAELERRVDSQENELTRSKEQMLSALADIIEYRDSVSGEHTKRTSKMTEEIIMQLLTNAEYHDRLVELGYKEIIRAAPLHDIGKIAVPDSILLKPDRLTPEEFEEVKKHTTVGSEIVGLLKDSLDAKYYQHCRDICLHHHERWDGKGYPTGLAGEDIPLSARILAVTDVFDALTNERPYKRAFDIKTALEIIKEGSGTQFDPIVVDAMLQLYKEYGV